MYGDDDRGTTIVDSPSKLLCLRDAAEAGLMPSPKIGTNGGWGVACLNGPKNNFTMGDSTLAPTPGPPPDCGLLGWWNPDTLRCDYWSLPPTVAPTVVPTPSSHVVAMWVVASSVLFLILFLIWAVMKMTCRDGRSSPFCCVIFEGEILASLLSDI